MNGNRIVIKVGTSTLTYENGKLNLRRLEQLCKVLSDLHNSGKEIILVSSGAIGVGVGKLGLKERPSDIPHRQAVAAIGQCELMFMYDKIFGEYNNTVAQVLLTRRVTEVNILKENATNALEALIDMDIIPIVNENDTVAVDELEGASFGDNDMLSAIVASIINADKLIILTDIDGLYDSNPRENKNAKLINYVEKITDEIHKMAGGTGSLRGTGGMATKVMAADFATSRGIECSIINGSSPKKLYALLEGKEIGTTFKKQN